VAMPRALRSSGPRRSPWTPPTSPPSAAPRDISQTAPARHDTLSSPPPLPLPPRLLPHYPHRERRLTATTATILAHKEEEEVVVVVVAAAAAAAAAARARILQRRQRCCISGPSLWNHGTWPRATITLPSSTASPTASASAREMERRGEGGRERGGGRGGRREGQKGRRRARQRGKRRGYRAREGARGQGMQRKPQLPRETPRKPQLPRVPQPSRATRRRAEVLMQRASVQGVRYCTRRPPRRWQRARARARVPHTRTVAVPGAAPPSLRQRKSSIGRCGKRALWVAEKSPVGATKEPCRCGQRARYSHKRGMNEYGARPPA